MTGLSIALEAFHFLRPLWLLALLPLIAIGWSIRARRTHQPQTATGIAPHLRQALTIGEPAHRRFLPIDGVILALALLIMAAAGPTWSRQPDPFAAQSAPLVIALNVTSSMMANDLAPSRLERAKQKIRDLLTLREGARTALIAYAGSAHVKVPMTEDPGVMLPYLDGLAPDIMPVDGARAALAIDLGFDLLGAEAGGVLLVTDGIDPADTGAINAASTRLGVLLALPDEVTDRGIDQLSGLPVIAITADDADVRQIDRMLNAAQARAALALSDQPWHDRGLWLAWPAALLLLLGFRRGWTLQLGPMLVLLVVLPVSQSAQAEGVADWFYTPDQQGYRAYQRNAFGDAAEQFEDPLWRGYTLYRDGQYEEAVTMLDRVETAQAAFIKGMAHIKSRGYRDGVRSLQTALTRDPNYPGAEENLAVAIEIVEYIEELRERSDTGEESGIGADDIVFDNEANRGADTELEAEQDPMGGMLTTEQWMNTVDTRTGDFLRSRFALEALQAGAGSRSDTDAGSTPP
ncbi:MAG: VWA domain-containing protein [Pseudomonadota bacterium]